MKVLNQRPVRLLCLIRWEGLVIDPFIKCASLMISRVSAIVVVSKCFPLGEKNALLIDFELRWVAIGVCLDDFIFRASQILTEQSKPHVAKTLPDGCKLIELIFFSLKLDWNVMLPFWRKSRC